MASTPWSRATNIGATYVEVRGIVDSIGRTNNTIHVHNYRVQFRSGPGTFYDTNMRWLGQLPNGATRINQAYGSGTIGGAVTSGSPSFNVGVGASQSVISTQAGFADYTGNYWGGVYNFDIPNLGEPDGTLYVEAVDENSIRVRVNVTDWGEHATAGSVRAYIDSSYKNTNDNADVTHSGLTPNKQYYLKGWARNGGGKTDTTLGGDTYRTTLATASETSKTLKATSVDFVLSATQGRYTTTTKVQYRKQGDTTWLDSSTDTSATPNITVSNLMPSTNYEYRLSVTTTAGTWAGSIQTLKTKPAVKLITTGGVIDAVPYLVDGSGAEMREVELI